VVLILVIISITVGITIRVTITIGIRIRKSAGITGRIIIGQTTTGIIISIRI
jgi:hypothetical protein